MVQHSEAAIDISADRYPEFWVELSTKVKILTDWRCCYPGCTASAWSGDTIETHHIITGELDENGIWQPVKLYIPGVMIVPLCDRHHSHRSDPECAHHKSNWFKGTRANKFRDARNTEQYHLLLVQGWYEKLLPQYRKQGV